MKSHLVAVAVTVAGAAGLIAILGLHGLFLYDLGTNLQWSMAVIAGVLALALIMHLGLLAPVAARFQKWHRGE